MGLSLVAQTITDVNISETESRSVQAFEAAEAGVEEALRQLGVGNTAPITLGSFGDFKADIAVSFSNASDSLTDRKISSGEATTFWLNSFQLDVDGEDFPFDGCSYDKKKVKICWEGSDNIEAAAYYVTGGDYKVKRYYLSDEGKKCTVGDFSKGAEIASLLDETKFINVRFYGESNDEVSVTMEGSGENLPQQGTTITSTATVNDVERKIEVVQGWPVPPMFFDFAVFSGGDLNK